MAGGMRRKSSESHPTLDVEAFKERLRSLGLKATPQRVAVHEAMISLTHASADMVAGHIAAEGRARVTVASVYNILSEMSGLGIYSRRLSSGNRMWFDVNAFNHVHGYDADNGTYIDIIDDELVKRLEDVLRKTRIKGYKVDWADIQLICRPRGKDKKKRM